MKFIFTSLCFFLVRWSAGVRVTTNFMGFKIRILAYRVFSTRSRHFVNLFDEWGRSYLWLSTFALDPSHWSSLTVNYDQLLSIIISQSIRLCSVYTTRWKPINLLLSICMDLYMTARLVITFRASYSTHLLSDSDGVSSHRTLAAQRG